MPCLRSAARFAIRAPLLPLALLALACTDSTAPEQPFAILPATQTLQVPRTVQLSTQGGPGTGAVSWESSNQSVATVSSSGLVTARFPGAATITARRGQRSATVSLTMMAAWLDLLPNPASVAVGGSQTLTANARGADGAVIGNVPLTWASANPGIATVDPSTGAVTGTSVGQTTVTVSGGGVTRTASVTVIAQDLTLGPADQTLQVARTLQLAAQTPVGPVTWASSDPSVASVSGTGLVTATAPGRVTITATSGVQAGTTSVTVIPPLPTNVTLDFSTCPADSRPIWVAFQDGSGAWTQVLGSADVDVYRFNVSSARGGYAYVGTRGTGVTVSLASHAELTSATISPCGVASPGLKSVSGTIVGSSAGDAVYVGLGGGYAGTEGGPVGTTFTLIDVRDGPQDLIAYRSTPLAFSAPERAIIRRDLNIANGGTLGPIDFAAAESFAPATARLTVTGAGPALVGHYMSYYTGAGCSGSDLYDDPRPGTQFPMRGIPAAQQRATDFHVVTVYSSGGNASRYGSESFHTLADRVVTLPADLPVPTITALPGGHTRIQAALTLPPEYQHVSLSMYSGSGGGVTFADLTVSPAWLGGSSVTLAVPDFSSVTGWQSSFLPPAGASFRWFLIARGANSAGAGGACVENARSVAAYMSGAG